MPDVGRTRAEHGAGSGRPDHSGGERLERERDQNGLEGHAPVQFGGPRPGVSER